MDQKANVQDRICDALAVRNAAARRWIETDKRKAEARKAASQTKPNQKGSNMPTNGTAVQIMASALTNRALSIRIAALRDNRRAYDKATTNALLDEAQRRLYWQDAYEKHAEGGPDSGEVRDRAYAIISAQGKQPLDATSEEWVKACDQARTELREEAK